MKRNWARAALGAVSLATLLAVGTVPAVAKPGASAGGAAQDGYNAIPSMVSGNVPSVGFQASQTNEFGDEVALGGSGRSLQSMSVVLSSWACQSGSWYSGDCWTAPGATFDVPITFTVYADGAGAPGSVIARNTRTFAVAYRPSASPQCTGEDEGKWYNAQDRTCYNGVPQTVTTRFAGQALGDQVFWSVAFSTSGYGPIPQGYDQPCSSSSGGCAYDSLNVGVFSFPHAPYSGADVSEGQVLRNGAVESGWSGYRPLGALVAK